MNLNFLERFSNFPNYVLFSECIPGLNPQITQLEAKVTFAKTGSWYTQGKCAKFCALDSVFGALEMSVLFCWRSSCGHVTEVWGAVKFVRLALAAGMQNFVFFFKCNPAITKQNFIIVFSYRVGERSWEIKCHNQTNDRWNFIRSVFHITKFTIYKEFRKVTYSDR